MHGYRPPHFRPQITARWLLVSFCCLVFLAACGRTVPIEEIRGIMASTIWVDQAPDGDVGQFNSLAADSRGNPHISYYDYTSGALKYARLDSNTGTWVTEVVDQEGDVGMYTSLAIDSEDRPHITYYDASNSRLKYAYFTGVEWRRSVLFNRPGGLFASMALDDNDVTHVAFISEGHFDLVYMRWNSFGAGAEPEFTTVDRGTITGPSGIGGNIHGGISLKIRPESQQPIISYYHASFGALLVAARMPNHEAADTTGWRHWVVDGGVLIGQGRPDVGEHNSLAVSGEMDWHVSYHDRTNLTLKYARWDDDSERWMTELVDDDGIVGESSSIAVVCQNHPSSNARECRPVISYFDSSNNDLKVAMRRDNRPWQTFRADLSGMTGNYTSIAEVSQGRVGVSYRDFTYSGLKFLLIRPF